MKQSFYNYRIIDFSAPLDNRGRKITYSPNFRISINSDRN
jgi:hypothetical protein